MDNKLSELKAAAMAATPGPWFRSSVQFNGITTEETFITQGNKPHLANASEKRDAIFIAAANPAVVLALLAELEAKDEQNKLLIREIEHGKKLRVNMQNNADSLSERIAELSQLLAHNIKLAEEAEAKLATPVRLPKRWDVSGQVNPPRIVEVQFEQQNRTHDQCAKAIRDAGFTVVVEGDE